MSDARPRVVHVLPGLGLGGAERILLTWLRHSGAEFCNEVWLGRGGALVEAARAVGARVYVNRQALTQVRAGAPAAVMGWLHHGNAAACALQRGLWPRARLVLSHHAGPLAGQGPWHRRLAKQVERLASPWAHAHLFVAAESARMHLACGQSLQRAWRLPAGIDTQRFRPHTGAAKALHAQLALPAHARLVGLVGRYDPAKAQAHGIRAFFARAQPRDHLLLVGSGLHPLPAALAAPLAPHERARLHTLAPRRQGMARLLAGLSALLLSSQSEALPLVVLEAMACQVPCATTAVGDLPEVLAQRGWLAAANLPGALGDALQKALQAHDAALALPCGAQAQRLQAHRRWVEQKHGVAALVRQLGHVLQARR